MKARTSVFDASPAGVPWDKVQVWNEEKAGGADTGPICRL